jgi:GcrA cell cycle regulator
MAGALPVPDDRVHPSFGDRRDPMRRVRTEIRGGAVRAHPGVGTVDRIGVGVGVHRGCVRFGAAWHGPILARNTSVPALPLDLGPVSLYLGTSHLECVVERTPETAMTWTDERVETLKKMWAEGQSASQIAKELGGVTRNAVIGKVHRLGLSNRVGPGGAPEAEEEDLIMPVPPRIDPPPPESEEPVEPEVEPEPLVAEAPADILAAPSAVVTALPVRKLIIPAGQPLPPQPSANEISPEALASVREVEKRAKRLTLMELTERTCKWPIGDPATEDFWFCGLPSLPGKPYCEAHVGVAFQPMSARRDRRR